jgi:hypothetical protein
MGCRVTFWLILKHQNTSDSGHGCRDGRILLIAHNNIIYYRLLVVLVHGRVTRVDTTVRRSGSMLLYLSTCV